MNPYHDWLPEESLDDLAQVGVRLLRVIVRVERDVPVVVMRELAIDELGTFLARKQLLNLLQTDQSDQNRT